MRSLISDSFMDLMKMKSEKGSQRGSKCLSVSIIICLPHYNKNSIFNLCNYISFFFALFPHFRLFFEFNSKTAAAVTESEKIFFFPFIIKSFCAW